ncbi:hypothetical protein Syun_006801 [Stephania yunnanensis]|uniref:Uncharacterized protein n=1 Tax=Stephania yunnanensis TaxID=152371 RepID=A0AAP0KYA3_9MAGN
MGSPGRASREHAQCGGTPNGARFSPRSQQRRLHGHNNNRALAAAAIRVGPHPESIGGPGSSVPHQPEAHRRPPSASLPDNFKHSLTLFSKSFSSFPRGTCSLSDSRRYLALDGICRRLGLHSQTTRLDDGSSWCDGVEHDGALTLSAPLSGDLNRSSARMLLRTTIQTTSPFDFHLWALPVRSPLLRESSKFLFLAY